VTVASAVLATIARATALTVKSWILIDGAYSVIVAEQIFFKSMHLDANAP
jgi:hypothetical protein